MQHAWKCWETHTKFYSESVSERDNLEYLEVDGKVILQRILKEFGV
jgi:hypothetical protein